MTAPDEALRELALAATPGPWERHRDAVVKRDVDYVLATTDHIATAAFIAAANPTAVLALLDERDALRGAVERIANEISRFARWGGEVADESADRAIAYQIVTRRLRAALDQP